MKAAVIYDEITDEMIGFIKTADEIIDNWSLIPEHSGTNVIEIPLNHPVQYDTRKWYTESGLLLAKNILTFISDKIQFNADGIDAVTITVQNVTTPVDVEIRPVEIVEVSIADNQIQLTSDIPQLFEIVLVQNKYYYADSIYVEAV